MSAVAFFCRSLAYLGGRCESWACVQWERWWGCRPSPRPTPWRKEPQQGGRPPALSCLGTADAHLPVLDPAQGPGLRGRRRVRLLCPASFLRAGAGCSGLLFRERRRLCPPRRGCGGPGDRRALAIGAAGAAAARPEPGGHCDPGRRRGRALSRRRRQLARKGRGVCVLTLGWAELLSWFFPLGAGCWAMQVYGKMKGFKRERGPPLRILLSYPLPCFTNRMFSCLRSPPPLPRQGACPGFCCSIAVSDLEPGLTPFHPTLGFTLVSTRVRSHLKAVMSLQEARG